MQAKNGDGARTVWDVLQYLITIPDVKEVIKEDGSKFKLRFAADGRRTSRRISTGPPQKIAQKENKGDLFAAPGE